MARAAILHAVGDEELDLRDDVTTVETGPAEVRVKIKATGVCHSDLSAMTGVLPMSSPTVIGHEGAGEILEVGDHVTSVQPGDHVVVNWTPDCGTCAECLRGEPYLCMTFLGDSFGNPRFRIGGDTPAFGMAGVGTWAEEIVLPHQAVLKIDPDVPFEYAALLGCGIPTGVGAVFNTAKVEPGSTVAVVGAGGVGLAVIQGARIAGASTILAIDPNEAKHPIAKQFGATHTATLDTLDETKGLLTGGGFDYTFEVVGKSAAITTAWRTTRRGGDVIVVGAGAATDNFEMSAFSLLFEGKSIKASLYGGSYLKRDVPRFVALWRAGKLDIENLITRRIRFEELNDAVRALTNGEVIRQVVLFD
ncbi:alcohol dehydrogenase catalytic domain-containing protein [Actinomadura alba]|uniref:Alcohol dehydrogenase catalytic domain-containing protein n=1 Tax=Actinomadura alba TaxID=406431 RepID=A0ABR7LYL4_9ACTN|nr:alcohol dehydrogenase catalytic domain-containing protein [Actinomadura alba]MBC6469866.1 alcohol dehydrogenase catalytic domain-containing protein [Actinomadura alba]